MLFIGGITAVLLDLAQPRVRSRISDHSTFRAQPLTRMKRTSLAAMVAVYGAQSSARRMIEGVTRQRERVHGHTPDGTLYEALDRN